jgi:multidrug efflux pump subunit AcrA (membrane-fusion protein)
VRRKAWVPAVLVVLAGAAVAMSAANDATPAAQESPANTVQVERGSLAAMVSLDGTLTHRARSDGSPYLAINRASGIYTELPREGDKVGCGDVLYRVDEDPVLLLCGTVPAYRDLADGDEGKDVRQLNRNLGYDGDEFTWRTKEALEELGFDGDLGLGDAIFLPGPARISKVTGTLGGSARPGAPVAHATSGRLEVRVNLEASQRGVVRKGDRARITLPGNRSVEGTVDRLGRVAKEATIPASISLDNPKQARGLDRAPVRVDITTKGVESALSVPVTALVGRSGGGFAVEVVRDDGRRELVAVELGLFDTANGRVEVGGDVGEGDAVVVPSL